MSAATGHQPLCVDLHAHHMTFMRVALTVILNFDVCAMQLNVPEMDVAGEVSGSHHGPAEPDATQETVGLVEDVQAGDVGPVGHVPEPDGAVITGAGEETFIYL